MHQPRTRPAPPGLGMTRRGEWRDWLVQQLQRRDPTLPAAEASRRVAIAEQDFPGLYPRALSVLVRAGYYCRAHIAQTPDAELLRLRGFGPKALARVRQLPPCAGHGAVPPAGSPTS